MPATTWGRAAGANAGKRLLATLALGLCLALFLALFLAACSTAPTPVEKTSGETAAQGTAGGSGAKVPDDAETAAAEKVASMPTVVILDASGSMKVEDAPGPRFEAARRAVGDLAERIPEGMETGLVTYGTGTGNSPAEQTAGCQDVTTLVPLGPIDKDEFMSHVNSIKPSGYTPIGLALQRAAEELPDSGERSIILLSDGIDTCSAGATADGGGDVREVCETAKGLASDGKLTIHTVGFRTDAVTTEQLACIAEGTGGESWDALNEEQLASRLTAMLTPGLADTRLSPDGFAGLTPGMTVAEARQAAGFKDEVAEAGRVEIVFKDCTLVFEDGKLTEIASVKVPTLDGVKVGDDIGRAAALYQMEGLPVEVKDGAVIFTSNAMTGLGYKIYFEGADTYSTGAELKGKITKIVLCGCGSAGMKTKFVSADPWESGTAEGLPVTPSSEGVNCWTVGQGGRGNSARCMEGHTIWDPCFVNPDGTQIACATMDGYRKYDQVTFDGSFDPSQMETQVDPTPVELFLADGSRCQAGTGAGPMGAPGFPTWRGYCSGATAGPWRTGGANEGVGFQKYLYPKPGVQGVWQVAVSVGDETSKPVMVDVETARY